MTFSIVAHCRKTGQFGIGAATGVPAVGKLLTHAAAGVGAVATQAKLNPYLGIDGIRYLRKNATASEVRDKLAAGDPRRTMRQFAVMDRTGATAVFTGDECIPWAGSLEGPGYSVQGNRLAGPHVLEAAAAAFTQNPEHSLADRLMEALTAGDGAGGDRKGEISATIYVVEHEEYPLWDIRVDEHEDPVRELRRLHAIFGQQVVPEIRSMPTRSEPAGAEREEPV